MANVRRQFIFASTQQSKKRGSSLEPAHGNDTAEMAPNRHGTVDSRSGIDSDYAKYVLVVLSLVYVLNILDRQLLTILAEAIKADLGISDADLGFLYGTAFSVFYATFGLALGRLADAGVARSSLS